MTYIIIAGIIVVLAAAWSVISWLNIRGIEQPKYKVLKKINGLEIRHYGEHIIAETEAKGQYREAATACFTTLGGYIFGGNKKHSKISMTAPVIMEEKDRGSHSMSFVMPAKYTLETLPAPDASNIKFRKLPARKVAVISFRWWLTPARTEKKKALLLKKIKDAGLTRRDPKSPPLLAGYDPPWNAPWMMHSEVMAEVE